MFDELISNFEKMQNQNDTFVGLNANHNQLKANMVNNKTNAICKESDEKMKRLGKRTLAIV